METFALLLAPMAPHLGEELWQILLGHDRTLAYEPWPAYDPALLKDDEIEVPVQVNGKLAGEGRWCPAESDSAAIEQAARADERIAAMLEGKTIRKVVVVPGKLVNFVVGLTGRVRCRRNGTSRYIIGIDLGTTNCAVAYVDTQGRERPSADIRDFEVPQLVAPAETAPRPMLPSFLYLPGEHELPPGAARLPWDESADRIVGEFARIQGATRAGPAGQQRQELALPPGHRPRGGHPAVGQRARRSRRSRRSRRRPAYLAAYPRRLERHSSRTPTRPTGSSSRRSC